MKSSPIAYFCGKTSVFDALMSRNFAATIESSSSYVAVSIAAALIFVAPWAYGGVEHWFRSYQALFLAVGVISAGGFFARIDTARTLKMVFVALSPLLILLTVAGIQEVKGEFVASSDGHFESIYPAATRLAFATLLTALGGMLLGCLLFSREPYFSVLLFTCLVSAALVAFLGIAMRLTGDDRVIRGLTVFGDPFARFVNRNNAASFMLLGVSSGLALLCKTTRKPAMDEKQSQFENALFRIDRSTVIAITVTLVTLCLGGILASRSRSGILAAALTVITGLLFMRLRGTILKTALGFSVAAGALGLVAWLGLAEGTISRFRSLRTDEVVSTGRIPHWIDAFHAFQARPLLGFGLGTYGYAHPRYSEHVSELWYEHADNQFVELAVEGGIAGLSSLLVLFGISGFAVLTNVDYWQEKVLVTSLVMGLSAHSLFDYGIIVPAVLLPASFLWSSGIARLIFLAPSGPPQRSHIAPRATITFLSVALAASLVWASSEYRKAWEVDYESLDSNRLTRPHALSSEALDSRVERLKSALVARPDDAEGQRSLAQLLVYRYRSTAFEALMAANPMLDQKAAWDATNLIALHRAATALARAGAGRGIDAIQSDPLTQRDLLPARQHYLESLEACPFLPGVHLPLNALRFTDGFEGDVLATTELEEASRLFPNDVGLLRTAGKMAWQAGNDRLAQGLWQRAFRLSSNGFGPMIQFVSQEAGVETAVSLLLPQTAEAALSVASSPEILEDPELRVKVADHLSKLAQPLPRGSLRQRLMGIAAWYEGDDSEASVLLRNAIELAPLDASARVDLAYFDWASGRKQAALQQLGTAITLEPERDDLRRLYATWEATWKQTPARNFRQPL